MLELVKNAIEERQILELQYSPGLRCVEPHAIGYSKDGEVLLRAFQTGGASASGESANWKLFRLDRATGISVSAAVFSGPRQGYKRGDRAMKGGLIAEL